MSARSGNCAFTVQYELIVDHFDLLFFLYALLILLGFFFHQMHNSSNNVISQYALAINQTEPNKTHVGRPLRGTTIKCPMWEDFFRLQCELREAATGSGV